MNNTQRTRIYHDYNPAAGYPAGSNLYYECLGCGDIVPSQPPDSVACKCRNIMIDFDYGRLKIQDALTTKLFSYLE